MRRLIVGTTLLVAAGSLLALPLASSGKPKLVDQLRGGVDRTLSNANTVAEKLREQQRKLREQLARERRRREAVKRANATPRAPSPGPQGTAYTPPLHGTNPHGQGTVGTQDLPPSSLRPLPADTKGGNGEILVAGRSRGEQIANGTYHGHITVAALLGNELVGVNTNPGESRAGPLDAIQQGLLTPLCNATSQGVCLTALTADSATTATGSTNKFSIATAALGGPTGINAGVSSSNGNISEDANCQTARGDSSVANARVGAALTADAIEATSTSRKCKDGTQSQTNTSKVVNLQNVPVAVPPLISQMCATGVPNTPALVNVLLPAVCNADQSNSAQAGPVNGNREGLTTFALDLGTNALLKTTTAQGESRAVKNAQCSDGIDNDGDGKIDFPADPGCTSITDDSEADNGNKPECSDGKDNDGDGKIDFPADPGCSSRSDNSEADGATNKPECSDGKDNDGDGKIDFPADPGCSSAKDDSEGSDGGGVAGAGGGGRGNASECSDGIDNDGDGKIDFPADPGCSSAADDSEADNGNGNRLAFTGTNVLLAGLIGSLLLLSGLGLRATLRSRKSLAPIQRRSGLQGR